MLLEDGSPVRVFTINGSDEDEEAAHFEECLNRADWIVHFAGPPIEMEFEDIQRCIDCGAELPTSDGYFWEPETYVSVAHTEDPFQSGEPRTFAHNVPMDADLLANEVYCRDLKPVESPSEESIY